MWEHGEVVHVERFEGVGDFRCDAQQVVAMFTGGAVLSAPLLMVGNTDWISTRNGIGLSLYLGVVTIGVV